MADAAQIVVSFFAECATGKSAMTSAFRKYFTPDTVWELVGSTVTTGADQALAKVTSTQEFHGMDHLVSEILAIATVGGSVLTERIDNVRRADGTNLASCRCMGIFEVENDRITAWREYYDTATYG